MSRNNRWKKSFIGNNLIKIWLTKPESTRLSRFLFFFWFKASAIIYICSTSTQVMKTARQNKK